MQSTSPIVRSLNSKSNHAAARRKLSTAARSATNFPETNAMIERLEGRTLMSAGDVMSTFAPANTNFGGTDVARAVVVQPDNRVVVAGSWDAGASDFAVARYNPDGSLDSSFGGGHFGAGSGKTNVTFGNIEYANAVALQPDGKIVVVGNTNATGVGGNDFAIARFNSDGSIDTSFNGTGKRTIDFGHDDHATGVAIEPNGQIVVGGYDDGGASDFAVARLNSDGSLDTSFGNGGTNSFSFGNADFAEGLALQSDGKIVMAGYTNSTPDGSDDFAVARLTSSGFLDTSFNGTGEQTVGFAAGKDDQAHGVAIQPNGQIVVAGWTIGSYGVGDFAVSRLNTDGSLDTGFGSGGSSTVSIGNDLFSESYGEAVALQSDGKIVMGGYSYFSPVADSAFARFNTDGSLDYTFGNSGTVVQSLGGTSTTTYSIAIAGDGDIYSAGADNVTGDFNFLTFGIQGGEYAYHGTPFTVNQTIEAEDFDNGGEGISYHDMDYLNNWATYRSSGVDIFAGAGSTGYGIGEVGSGEWTNYTVTIPSSGLYGVQISCGSLEVGSPINVSFDGSAGVTTTDTSTGSWYTFKTISTSYQYLSAGTHILKVATPGGLLNIDWLKVVPAYASISGTVYNDADGNGVQSGSENGLANWNVYLDLNDDGDEDFGEPVTTTNSIGQYTFNNVAPATYEVREVLQSGWQPTVPGSFSSVTITSGTNATNLNFGNKKIVMKGMLTGTVFSDTNIDGKLESGEAGLANVGVYLDTNNNGKFDIGEQGVLTNSNGTYTFSNLPAGSYHVRLEAAAGYGSTAPSGSVYNASLAAGQTLTENFGETNKAIISGTLFFDANKNGKQDVGEPGLPSWGIFLDTNNNGILNVGETAVLTDSQGHYRLVLAPGTYHVREIVQSGFNPTAPSTKLITLTVKAGQIVTNVNFGDH